MPPRSVKMKRFIFGFQRRVWWPKWTPASSSSFMETTGMVAPFSVSIAVHRRASRGSRRVRARPPSTEVAPPGRRDVESTESYPDPAVARSVRVGGVPVAMRPGVRELGPELRLRCWELALEVVEEGLRDDSIPSLARLGRVAQLGDIPTFVSELGREVERPDGDRLRVGGALAGVAREHARTREALGFAPREVVTEFLLLRRVLWRFVASRAGA